MHPRHAPVSDHRRQGGPPAGFRALNSPIRGRRRSFNPGSPIAPRRRACQARGEPDWTRRTLAAWAEGDPHMESVTAPNPPKPSRSVRCAERLGCNIERWWTHCNAIGVLGRISGRRREPSPPAADAPRHRRCADDGPNAPRTAGRLSQIPTRWIWRDDLGVSPATTGTGARGTRLDTGARHAWFILEACPNAALATSCTAGLHYRLVPSGVWHAAYDSPHCAWRPPMAWGGPGGERNIATFTAEGSDPLGARADPDMVPVNTAKAGLGANHLPFLTGPKSAKLRPSRATTRFRRLRD